MGFRPWNAIKSLLSLDRQVKIDSAVKKEAARLNAADEKVPCYVCHTAVIPGEHVCPDSGAFIAARAQEKQRNVINDYFTIRGMLRDVIIAIETNSLTQELIDEAKEVLNLT